MFSNCQVTKIPLRSQHIFSRANLTHLVTSVDHHHEYIVDPVEDKVSVPILFDVDEDHLHIREEKRWYELRHVCLMVIDNIRKS